ncbi:MAG: class IV adenylate cyclase [Spirochaetaceae bacterium]|nr:class IV adenylate cyclase [Spirochaetaceae bacterium]
MIYEIEEKVQINNADEIRAKLRSEFLENGTEVKYDTYFKNDQNKMVRMRESAKGLYVTLKEYGGDVPITKEVEFGINNKEDFRQFMEAIGFSECFKKVKKVELFTAKGLKYELVNIEGLGDFLEIEALKTSQDEAHLAIELVREAFSKLGFSKDKLITKNYHDLMQLDKR